MSGPDKFDEEKWKAESDAHTLAEAHAIAQDAERHKKAQEAAVRLKEETEKRAKEAKDHDEAMQALASRWYPTMDQNQGGGTPPQGGTTPPGGSVNG